MRRFRLSHYLKTSLWLVPLLCVLGAIVLSLTLTAVDDGSLVPQSVTGDATAALQILYLIAFAMLTLTGLVLSLLVVAVQLAMGTFSPRIVRQILQDRPSQAAIGLFAGTFTHALLSMRHVRTTPEGGTVPGLAVVVAIVLVLGCIGTLVWYLNHIAQSLRTAALVGWVARDTVTTLDHVYPDQGTDPDTGPDLVLAPRSGVVFEVGHDRLVAQAREAGCCLELLWAVGDFVPTGAPLVRVVGDPAGLSPKRVAGSVVLGPERTLNQDVAYGIRMLVDIAVRSLSSGPFDDPTTTVQAIDRLHDILRQIARRPLHSGRYRDAAGMLRLVAPTMQWEGFVRLAFDELRQAGAGSPQVSRRLRSALDDLLAVAPPDRRPPLERQLALLAELAAAAAPSDADREAATVPDPSGIGSAAELVTAGVPSPARPPRRATEGHPR
ncbi:Uncharacterized membrane protein [Geodermatophilus pulveris]|uniref:Uncharacterized membrane protein n=1 Tax=Geodermatophilus pulveris TaxID=1564159 RepID=A0A239EFM8_9ACTN|nr:DUF2254 domain-containing protein [Geodermatophilus pulveris]SNS43427.1 Uncharacterized membrane protein [Geodermatophilus pulveris]